MQPRLFHLELEKDTPKPPCFVREKRAKLTITDKVGVTTAVCRRE